MIRMDDTRTPKMLLYGRIDRGASKQGNHLTYINSVKSLLREYDIDPKALEKNAANRTAWRSKVNSKTKQVHETMIHDLKELRRIRRAGVGSALVRV